MEAAHGQLGRLAWRYPERKILDIEFLERPGTASYTILILFFENNLALQSDCKIIHRTAQDTTIMAAPEKAMSSRLLTMKV
jgi:hypothetical protein